MPGQITSKGTVLVLVRGSSSVSDSNMSFVASPTMAVRSTLLVLLVAAMVAMLVLALLLSPSWGCSRGK